MQNNNNRIAPFSEAPLQDCVIYARYSSHAQREASIEQQVADCEAYARMNNLRVVKVYADCHLTGKNDKRPQFQKMLKDAERGRWAYVLTWKVDRFARNRYDSATYKYRLKRHGVRVLYAKESIPDGPEGILLESILEGSAEYYSANLAQNVKRGMHYNALDCKVNNGFAYGYCRGQDGRYAIMESEAEVVREIFRRVGEGEAFASIANDLNGRGIHTKRGGLWGKNSFHALLKNESYIGVYRYADVRVEGGMPSIVDKALFLEVADRLKTKKNPQGRHRENGEYMLTGKLFCGPCGSPMIGMSGTGRNGLHYYYACQNRRNGGGCEKKNAVRDDLERAVVQATLDHILKDDVLQWVADSVMAYQERENNSAVLCGLRDDLAQNKQEIENVLKAIRAGIITASTQKLLVELEAEGSRLENAIYLEEASLTHIERDFVIYWLEKFRGGNVNDVAFRRKVIDSLVNAVFLWDDHIRIAFNYSGKGSAVDLALVLEAESAAGAEGSYKASFGPPNCEGKNSCSNRGSYLRFSYPVIPLDDGTFCVLAPLDDYRDHQSVVTRKATYRDIVRWVKQTYGVHVKNIDISRAKQRCGLAHMELDRPASPGYKPDRESPDREALVIEAFRHFGMI